MNELPFAHRICALREFEHIKLLAEENRLAILRQLMVAPATLSQLSKRLGTYPARLRHHVKLLEEAGLIDLMDMRVGQGYVEKYYQATARAFVVNLTVLPLAKAAGALVVWGSDDWLLERLAQHSQEIEALPNLFTLPVGSLDGLIALRQGLCQLVGCHLLDAETGTYNDGYVRCLFPGMPMSLVTLAHRQQGLLVAPGNPLGITGIADLTRSGVRLANRMRGAGTRLWLDAQLRELGIAGEKVRGYETGWKTHGQVAQAVARGEADVGLALVAAARPFQLDVIPLFAEQYDLVFLASEMEQEGLRPLLAYLQTPQFQQLVAGLEGYDAGASGQLRTITA